ncbi:MAG: hypothetical protein AAF570_15525, partial [Bacteroidota bacterium]
WTYKTLYDGFAKLTAAEKQAITRNVPTDPKTADYPATLQPYSNLINAVFTYLFMMTRECYEHAVPKQTEIFNFGMHKGMIFILDRLCGNFVTQQIDPDDKSDYPAVAGPTFERYDFSQNKSLDAKQQMLQLFDMVPPSQGINPEIRGRIADLPDLPIRRGERVRF